MEAKENVIVLGASDNPERYSYKAIQMLKQHNHHVVGVHPSITEVSGIPVFKSLLEAKEALGTVDTVTVYLSPKRSLPLADEICKVHPRRVILNPGTESEELETALRNSKIEVIEACTLVLLSTNQY